MSDPNTPNSPATSPAASGGLTLEAVTAAVQQAVASATKPLQEKLVALEGQVKTQAEASAKALTPDAVKKLLGEELAAQKSAADKTAERGKFVGDKLKDLPAVYADKLGGDPAKWEEEAKGLRESYKADLAKAGFKAAPVSSDPPPASGGTPAAAAADLSKLSPYQLLQMGVKATAKNLAPPAEATPAAK